MFHTIMLTGSVEMSTFRYNGHMNMQNYPLNVAMRRKFDRVRSISQIQQMDPVEFEYFVGYLYQKEGYLVSQYGTDAHGGYLMLRKGVETLVVQCLPPGMTITEVQVRDLYNIMQRSGADKAVAVTSGAITPAAEVWGAGKPVTLLDGRALVSRIKWLQANSRPAWLIPAIWAGVIIIGLFLCLGVGALVAGPLREVLAGIVAQPTVPPVPTTPAGPTRETGNGSPAPVITEPPPGAPTITRPVEAGTIAIPLLAATPGVDGNLADWPNVPAHISEYRVFSADSWDGSDDLEATWQLGWTVEGLYVGVTVVDDRHVQIESGRLAYQGDSLEMQIDTDVAGDFGPTVSADDYQFLLSPGDFGGNPPSAFRFQGVTGTGAYRDAEGFGVVVAARPVGSGYTLEAFIPWADMNVTPRAGLELGVSLNATDNDTPNTAIQEVMYASSRNRRHTDPTTWAPFVLGIDNRLRNTPVPASNTRSSDYDSSSHQNNYPFPDTSPYFSRESRLSGYSGRYSLLERGGLQS